MIIFSILYQLCLYGVVMNVFRLLHKRTQSCFHEPLLINFLPEVEEYFKAAVKIPGNGRN